MLQEKEFVPDFFANQVTGRFLEIGANDGEPGSPNEPIWPLVEKGWTGVYVEPNPKSCYGLLKNIRGKDIQVINGAISLEGGFQDFYISEEHAATCSLDPKWTKNQLDRIVTNTFTLPELVNLIGTDFDIISVDIENDHDVYEKFCKTFDWSIFTKCKMIVWELSNDFVEDYFKSLGYTCAGTSLYNTIFCRNRKGKASEL